VSMIELTDGGQRLAQRFLARLEAQTHDLRAGWPAQRQQLAVQVLEEISIALDETCQSGRLQRRRAHKSREMR
jgi:hypothetical protein